MQAGFLIVVLLGLAIVRSLGGLSTEQPFIKDEFQMDFPKADYGGYPGLVSGKTNFLLEEAENMLSRVKVFKERLWLQTFVFKMRKLAATMKQSISLNVESQTKKESIERNIKESTLQASVIRNVEESPLAKVDDRVARHRKSNVQPTKERHTVTMPNKKLDFTTRQYNTQKQDFQTMRQVDELARELEELPLIAVEEHSQRKRPVKRSNVMDVYDAANAVEKRKIERELGKEILKLKEMGSSPYEIEMALGLDEPMTLKLLRPYMSSYSDGLKVMTHGYHKDKSAYQRKTNINQPTKPPTNTSREDNHFSLFPVKESIEKLQTQSYPTALPPSIQSLLRKLHRENYLLKRRLKAIRSGHLDKGSSRISQHHTNPFSTNQIVMERYGIRNPFTSTSNLRSLDTFNPTSYSKYLNPFNPINNISSVTPTSKNSDTSTPTSNDTQFSDEIKRELIDGKVILLSHSVVPSNFDMEKSPLQPDLKIQA